MVHDGINYDRHKNVSLTVVVDIIYTHMSLCVNIQH